MSLRFVVSVCVALAAALVVTSLPGIARYLEMREM
jgi:Family of unknown function (DUF6893)